MIGKRADESRMTLGRAIRRKVKAVFPPAFFLALIAYFAWNTNQGDHGRRSFREQSQILARAQSAHDAAIAEQAAWSQRVSGLRDHGLDADTLDERSRAMLNLAQPNDLVVPYGQSNKLY